MSLKNYISRIDTTKNLSEINISILTVLKVNNFADFADFACKQEILLGQTAFDHVHRCVREVVIVEYFTRKRYFTSRVVFGVRTIHEVLVDCCHATIRQWLPEGHAVMCTSDNVKEVFKAKIKELNKIAMRELSNAIN